jgi:hypothetical protein
MQGEGGLDGAEANTSTNNHVKKKDLAFFFLVGIPRNHYFFLEGICWLS